MVNLGSNLCVDSSAQSDPAMLMPCNQSLPSQLWTLQSSGHIASGSSCLDVFNFAGPNVDYYSCKVPGQQDANQVWQYNLATKQIHSADPQLPR